MMHLLRPPHIGNFAPSRRARMGIALATTVAAGLFLGHLLQQRATAARAERAVSLQPALNEWHRRTDASLARFDEQRRAAQDLLDELSIELGVTQSRIVHLDALARHLITRADLDESEFDFDSEPGLGGPIDSAAAGAAAFGAELPAAAQRLSRQVDDRWRQLRVLEDLLEWRDLNAAVRPEGRPVGSAYVSSRFGSRIDPFTGRGAMHKGIDFAGRRGTEIVAVAAGIVTWSGPRWGYGRMVEIDHGNGHVTRYAHNSENLVEVGDVVTRGQTIAKLGSTGRATGPNLHFEVLQDGKAVNPLPYIE